MLYRPHSAPPPSYTMVQQPTYVQGAPMLPPTLPNYIYQPQVAFQQGPPPSYGVPQYPTGYCPAPPYQRQIQPMQQHVMYSDPTMQVNVLFCMNIPTLHTAFRCIFSLKISCFVVVVSRRSTNLTPSHFHSTESRF